METVKVQMSMRTLRGWRSGVPGILLAVALLAGMILPAYADDNDTPPLTPHLFTGLARTANPAAVVPEGTLVQAFVGGVKKAETATNAQGVYALAVKGEVGDAGETVTFKVAGVQANETATWTSGGWEQDFTLTISRMPSNGGGFPLPFDCFIATAAYGSATAEEINVLRDFRDAVLLPNSLGARLVSFYYRTSPPIAGFISGYDLLRTAVRVGLVDPIVALLKRSHDVWSRRELIDVPDIVCPDMHQGK